MKRNLFYASALAIPFALLTAGNLNAKADTTSTQDQAPVENVQAESDSQQTVAEPTTTTEESAQPVATTQATNSPLVVTNDPTAPDSDPEADARVAEGIAKAAGTQQLVNGSEATDTTQATTEPTNNQSTVGTSYWISNPDYYIWDTPYDANSTKVANASDYTHTQFTGLGQAVNDQNNVYENITNNDNVTGWIYLPALTTTDPNAATEDTSTTTTDDKTFLQKVTDKATQVSDATSAVKNAVDNTQKLIQEPGDVITNAITKPLDNITKIGKSVSGAVDTVTGPLKNIGSSIKSIGSGVLSAIKDIIGLIPGA